MNTRDNHFKMLNSYRDSKEYAEYANKLGIYSTPLDVEGRPSLIGRLWRIDENIYNEFLDLLPPIRHRANSFCMSERTFGSITTKYSKVGGYYYCEFVDLKKEP